MGTHPLISLKPLRPSDLRFATALYGKLRKETDEILVPDYCAAFNAEIFESPWTALFGSPCDFKGWAVWSANTPVGLLRIGKCDPDYLPFLDRPLPENTGELHELYLARSYQGKGLGAFLYKHARHELQAMGYAHMFLATYSCNTAAQGFYRAMGAVPFGEGPFENVLDGKSFSVQIAFWIQNLKP